jgi:RNA polymerase sigma factor (sigma-70 family)
MKEDVAGAAREGDAIALDQLMRERRTQVIRYAMRLCISPEDAEDAAQEALFALSKHIAGLRDVAALSSWLFSAVRTHCTRLARRSLKHALADDTDSFAAPDELTVEDELVDRQLRRRLAMIVGALAPELRDAIVRRDILDEPAIEAAAALGITVPALKSRLHRARALAKEALLRSFAEGSGKATRRPILRILRGG